MNHFATPPGGSDDNNVMAILLTILERQDVILEKQGGIETTLMGHMEREEAAIEKWMDSLPKTVEGNPDVAGHRLFHQELIEESRERKKMWRELRNELLKKSSWAVVAVIGALVAYWWNHEIRK